MACLLSRDLALRTQVCGEGSDHGVQGWELTGPKSTQLPPHCHLRGKLLLHSSEDTNSHTETQILKYIPKVQPEFRAKATTAYKGNAVHHGHYIAKLQSRTICDTKKAPLITLKSLI